VLNFLKPIVGIAAMICDTAKVNFYHSGLPVVSHAAKS
jgi:hypothetical protein